MDERIVETRHSHEGNHVPINGEIDNDTITQTQGNKMALEEIRPPPIMEAIPPPPIEETPPPPIIEKFPPPSPLRSLTRTRKQCFHFEGNSLLKGNFDKMKEI